MKFSKSELGIIYKYAAPAKSETFTGMEEIVSVINDLLTKVIVENTIRKLERIPESECSQYTALSFLMRAIRTQKPASIVGKSR